VFTYFARRPVETTTEQARALAALSAKLRAMPASAALMRSVLLGKSN
jgi:hypothetical protein